MKQPELQATLYKYLRILNAVLALRTGLRIEKDGWSTMEEPRRISFAERRQGRPPHADEVLLARSYLEEEPALLTWFQENLRHAKDEYVRETLVKAGLGSWYQLLLVLHAGEIKNALREANAELKKDTDTRTSKDDKTVHQLFNGNGKRGSTSAELRVPDTGAAATNSNAYRRRRL
jgi:hypothetical protein